MLLFFLEDLVGAFGRGMARFAGGHREIHGHGTVDEKDAALFAQGDFHRGVLRGGIGQEFLVAVSLLAPAGLGAESGVGLVLPGHLLLFRPLAGVLDQGAARKEENGGEERGEAGGGGRFHQRLGRPETVCMIPVIME